MGHLSVSVQQRSEIHDKRTEGYRPEGVYPYRARVTGYRQRANLDGVVFQFAFNGLHPLDMLQGVKCLG